MIVCSCRRVRDTDIREFIAHAERPPRLRDLRRCLGVCGECGRCGPSAQRLLRDYQTEWRQATCLESRCLDAIQPNGTGIAPAMPLVASKFDESELIEPDALIADAFSTSTRSGNAAQTAI